MTAGSALEKQERERLIGIIKSLRRVASQSSWAHSVDDPNCNCKGCLLARVDAEFFPKTPSDFKRS